MTRGKRAGEAVTAEAFLYTYVCHEEERELCRLELRTLLGAEPAAGYMVSSRCIEPSRSPFVKERMAVQLTADSLADLAQLVSGQVVLGDESFKVVFVKADAACTYDERRAAEREIGRTIEGRAQMREPDRLFGIARIDGRWLFGECCRTEAVWLRHNEKPVPYSTALGTRVARAVVNIAVPFPDGMHAVDPCCGIGTVVLEALSMGIHIEGFDINPLAVRGARLNLRHFGYPEFVRIGDVRELPEHYDAAVLDLPYNLCSVLPEQEQMQMLAAVRRLADRAVIIATEPIERALDTAGFAIADSCMVRKGRFIRIIFVCE